MRDYGKIFTTFWTSRMSNDGKFLGAYLLTGPHTNMIGVFRLPLGYIVADLRWSKKRVSRGLAELFQNGFATYESEFEWVVINKYLKWNPIENPNQARAAFKLFEQIPKDSPAKALSAKAFSRYVDKLSTGEQRLLQPFLNPSETLSEPFPNQDQEQEQKQEQEQDTPPNPPSGGERAPAPDQLKITSVQTAELMTVNGPPLSDQPEPFYVEDMDYKADPGPALAAELVTAAGDDDGFEAFWQAYPRKQAKARAAAAWHKLVKSGRLPPPGLIQAALTAQTQSPDWRKDGGQFIPYPASWLSAERWLDEATKTKSTLQSDWEFLKSL